MVKFGDQHTSFEAIGFGNYGNNGMWTELSGKTKSPIIRVNQNQIIDKFYQGGGAKAYYLDNPGNV